MTIKKEDIEAIQRLIHHTSSKQTLAFRTTEYGKGFLDGLYHVKETILENLK